MRYEKYDCNIIKKRTHDKIIKHINGWHPTLNGFPIGLKSFFYTNILALKFLLINIKLLLG